jgi:putative spermidine/putrescine transport system ATP-binding protein
MTADSAKNEPMVRFAKVQKSYDGETLVVKDLNLDIAKGEFLTMLGPSGSGKTTTLMMLAGFEPATHGEIYVKGKPINNTPPHKRGIGMVFQNYALFPHMTVAENLAFPLQVRNIKAELRTASSILKLVGFRRWRAAGGALWRPAAAHRRPAPCLLTSSMDEPLGPRQALREQMQYEVKHIHERLGVTIVYVTHDQAEALTMSNRIAMFNDGVVQQFPRPMNS